VLFSVSLSHRDPSLAWVRAGRVLIALFRPAILLPYSQIGSNIPMAEYPQIGLRVTDELLKLIDEWRRKQDDPPSRPEAVRRLVELGLKVKGSK
jgi:hypothetical protein